ncbi:MAG TPA: ATP-binding protein [Ignavibacteriales bacterium]|nr:ATP-binding protein [Ignavibacteriales bacterium]
MLTKNIFTFLITINLALYSSSFSIDSTIYKNNYQIKYLGIEEGLPHLLINSIGEHPDGYLFISTQEGLILYNGFDFLDLPNYQGTELLNRYIKKIYKDNNNITWFISSYVPPVYFKNNQFKSILITDKNFSYINDIIHYNNLLLLATDKGLYSIENYKAKPSNLLNSNEEIISFCIDNNYLYLSLPNKVLKTIYKNGKLEIQQIYNIRYVRNIFFRKNNPYFITFNDGIYYYNYGKINHLTKINGLASNTINHAILTQNNDIWLATDYGVNKIDINNNITKFTVSNGLSSNQIQYIFEDFAQNIWFCPLGNKVTIFRNSYFYSFKNPTSKVNHNVFSFVVDNNFLVSGTYSYGIEIYNNKGKYIKTVNLPNSESNIINSIIKVENNYWVATNDGIYVLNQDFNIAEKISIPRIRQAGSLYYCKHSNRIYISAGYSFFYYDLSNKSLHKIASDFIITNIIGDKNGTIYIGTENTGIWIYKNNTLTNLFGKKENYSVVALYIDNSNNLWLCIEGKGLVRYNNNNYSILSSKNGLFNELFFAIEETEDNFWFSCNTGLFRISKQDLNDYFNGKINYVNSISYNQNNGIDNSEFNGGYNFPSAKSNNFLFFANVNGVVGFDQNKVILPPKAKIIIRNYYANNNIYFFKENIILPWNNNNRIEIFIDPIIFNNFNNYILYYKLSNETDWHIADKKGHIIYTNLKPGNYVLEISLTVDGNKNVVYKKFNLIVEGVFYRKVWFITLLTIIFFIGIIYFWDKIRTKKQLEKEKKLQQLVEEKTAELKAEKDKALLAYQEAEKALKIAEEQKQLAEIERQKAIEANKMKSEIVRLVAHDLKNPLGAIQSFASYIFEDIDDDKEYVLEHAKHIKEAADSTLVFVSELLRMAHLESGMIKPNITETSITSLINNIVSQNVQIAYEKAQEIIFENNLPENLLVKIDPLLTSEIINNYISNAIKYSPRCAQIKIRAQILDNKLRIAVIDKGPGILEEEKSKVFQKFQKLSAKPTAGESSHGLGLSIVKLLAEVQGAEVGFESEYGKGSTFFVDFDLEKIS